MTGPAPWWGAKSRARTCTLPSPPQRTEDPVDAGVQAWLLSQLGRDTDLTDLTARYTRLGTARAVAIELVRERLSDLRASPGSVSVSGVVSLNNAANIAAYERQLTELLSGEPPAPDDPTVPDDEDTGAFGLIQLVERPRR